MPQVKNRCFCQHAQTNNNELINDQSINCFHSSTCCLICVKIQEIWYFFFIKMVHILREHQENRSQWEATSLTRNMVLIELETIIYIDVIKLRNLTIILLCII
jgi:hypothetical protein